MRLRGKRRAVRHAGDGIGLDEVDAIATPDLSRIAVDFYLGGLDVDPMHIGPLTDEALGIDRLHGRVGVTMPDRHTRPRTLMRRCAAHQIAPDLCDVMPPLEHALECLLHIP